MVKEYEGLMLTSMSCQFLTTDMIATYEESDKNIRWIYRQRTTQVISS